MKKNVPPGNDELGLKIEQPGASARMPLSVGALTGTIRELLEKNLAALWVTGEISNLRTPTSGHLYFTLKDASATLSAVMFRLEAARIGFALRDGMAVVVRGSITVYEARGQYQIQVSEVRARGQGSLMQRFEELKRKLQAENLFSLDRKRPLPVFPERIGIVTALQGAVLQDMRQILQRRAPGIRLSVRGVRVQGPEAASEIAAAVRAFSEASDVDILVVARGGGSLEDLWAFNEEVVARAIAACSVPTISAVGHETDFTIADFVADLRVPTPSAAAELLTRDWADWRQEISALKQRLERDTRRAIEDLRSRHARMASCYALREPRRVVRQWVQRLDDLQNQLHTAAGETLHRRALMLQAIAQRLKSRHPTREVAHRSQHLAHLAARLRVLGPQATLDRGFALVLDDRKHVIIDAGEMKPGQSIRLLVRRGAAVATIQDAQPNAPFLEAMRGINSAAPAPLLAKNQDGEKRLPGRKLVQVRLEMLEKHLKRERLRQAGTAL